MDSFFNRNSVHKRDNLVYRESDMTCLMRKHPSSGSAVKDRVRFDGP
ncbi:MAG: hypothetical protein OJF52_000822 [Nitrospira sp.]|nr:MAG: hypothetical protein OJF52_000822 [Nitrospira sp.]